MEGVCDLRVDVDKHFLLDQQVLVALVDLLLHPVGEGIFQQSVADVGNPLPRQLQVLLIVGQIVVNNAVRSDKGCDITDRQAFILRHGYPSHVFAFDSFLLAGYEGLEKVDSDVLCEKEKQN